MTPLLKLLLGGMQRRQAYQPPRSALFKALGDLLNPKQPSVYSDKPSYDQTDPLSNPYKPPKPMKYKMNPYKSMGGY